MFWGDSEAIIALLNILYDIDTTKINSVSWKNSMDEVLELYKQNGGPAISEEEILNHDFNKLKDKKFILNEEDDN